MTKYNCKICGQNALEVIEDFYSLPRVTSDCRPLKRGGTLAICELCGAIQKPNISDWKLEVDEIYSSYQPYYQSNGVEQSVFGTKSNEPKFRISM